jgi:hypothetical protein
MPKAKVMMPICSIEEYANMRLMSRRRYSMNAAKTSEISPMVTINGPGASAAGLRASSILKRSNA